MDISDTASELMNAVDAHLTMIRLSALFLYSKPPPQKLCGEPS